jgi:hypothetical protein
MVSQAGSFGPRSSPTPKKTNVTRARKIYQALLVVQLFVLGHVVDYRVIAHVSSPACDYIATSSPLQIANSPQSRRAPHDYVLGAIAYGRDGTDCNVPGWVTPARAGRLGCVAGKLAG